LADDATRAGKAERKQQPGSRNSESERTTMLKSVVNFLKREDGPTAVEYAVMLALIIVVCIAAITTLGQKANATFGSINSGMTVGS
jgi:pilus assembly protein Flp/PilA